MSHVDLGYLEKTKPWLLKSHFFPSKVGGKPAWLALKNLPTPKELECGICNKPMTFLCQVYAPVEDNSNCFHRTLFLFVCRNTDCSISNDSKSFVVWRSQLEKENEFYSSEPPVENETNIFDVGKYVTVCTVCGCSSSKHCSKCKVTSYCSREHQMNDWREGHKQKCGSLDLKSEAVSKLLFDEFELITEQEEEEEVRSDDDDESEQKRLSDYQKLVEEGKVGTMSDIPEDELQSHAGLNEDDIFLEFRKRTLKNPDQVLRYNRAGEPLWIASEPRPSQIPCCEYCKSERQFEFQVLPQLLYKLHETNIDWGVIVVYTCKNNCSDGPTYKKEYVFKQDVKAS